MKEKILHDIRFMEKVLNMTCDTLFVIDSRNICVDAIVKTDNPVINPQVPIVGKDFLSLLPEDTADQIRKEIDYTRKTGIMSNANYDLPAGDQMYYFKFIIHKFDEEMLLCQYRDITQRSNMKRRLKSAITALLEVGKAAMIGHWSFDVENNTLTYSGFANVNRQNVLVPERISLEEFLAVVHVDDRERLQEFLLEDSDNYSTIEYRVAVPGSPVQYVRGTKYDKRFENNRWVIDGFSQNVTDFIKNRNELEMVLEVVFHVPYSVHANKLDGTLIFANRACREQNEIAATVLSDKKIYDVLKCVDTADRWKALVQEIRKGGGTFVFRCDEPYPDRGIICCECTSFIIKNGEGEEIVWTIQRDISDQLRYEEQLLRSKEAAEESEKLKTAFISNMNHEIRTPLSAIIGFSTIISETADPETRREYGKILMSNSSQLLRLITDVLEVSQMDAGRIRLLPERVSLNSILHEISISFRLPDNVAKLVVLPAAADVVADFDRGRIMQLLTNLINNSRKFTPPDGYIQVGYTAYDDMVEFFVKDNGIGIPKDKQELIFNRFFKMNAADKGTGLGLAICKGIVEQMNGRIWVESEEGKGATFKIQLPLTTRED